VVDVVPAHVADDLEAVGRTFPIAALPWTRRPHGSGPRAIRNVASFREEAQDPVHVAAVEGGVDSA